MQTILVTFLPIIIYSMINGIEVDSGVKRDLRLKTSSEKPTDLFAENRRRQSQLPRRRTPRSARRIPSSQPTT